MIGSHNLLTINRQFDIREQHSCRGDSNVLLVDLQRYIGPHAEAKCIAINPRRPAMLAVGANDMYARLYDRRMITLQKVDIDLRSIVLLLTKETVLNVAGKLSTGPFELPECGSSGRCRLGR